MTAPRPHTIPASRRAARQSRDDDVVPAGDILPQWVREAAASPSRRSNFVVAPPDMRASEDEMFVEPDLGNLVPAEASLPRVHRSTFTTEPPRRSGRPESVRSRAESPRALAGALDVGADEPRSDPVAWMSAGSRDTGARLLQDARPDSSDLQDRAPARLRRRGPAGVVRPPTQYDARLDDVRVSDTAVSGAAPDVAGSGGTVADVVPCVVLHAELDDVRLSDAGPGDAAPLGAPDAARPADAKRVARVPHPTTGPTRRAAREPELLESNVSAARHARDRRATRVRALFGLVAAAALVVGGATAVTAALTGSAVSDTAGHRIAQETTDAAAEASVTLAVPLPAPAESIPAPEVSAAPALVDVCADAAFTAALAAGDDRGAIAAAGGGEPFRAAVASGTATCVSLADPARTWVVINKQRPYEPIDYSPTGLVQPEGVRNLANTVLHGEAAAALTAMVAAASAAGAGEIALSSGFRSYGIQRSIHRGQVNARGVEAADLVSARAGHSEHQAGLAADVVACAGGGCGALDGLAGTPQGDWIAAHAWEYGWIVRDEEGRTDITGYAPELWHLRYIGTELSVAYHDGGWHTLEEFFGLPAAPAYPG